MTERHRRTSPRARSRPRCPICGQPLPPPTVVKGSPSERWPHFPFCSDRCRLLDLHRWLTGAYVIPGPPTDPEADSRPGGETETDR